MLYLTDEFFCVSQTCTKTLGYNMSADLFPTTSLEKIFIDNEIAMTMHTPMWQYFVTVQGVTTLYPPTANVCTGADVVRRYTTFICQ